MSLANITSHILATGSSVQVKVSTNSDTPDTIIGLATNVSYQENYALQRANVIGVLGAISIDPQDYTIEITVGTFVPAKLSMGNDTYQSDITKGVLEMLPKRSEIFSTTKGKVFQSLEFYDKDSSTTLARFIGVVLSNSGMDIQSQGYAKGNVQFWAVDKPI
jgi:hypothetical protein